MSSTDGKQLATGGAVLGIAMIMANAGNYILNVFLGRWLTPAEFADANLIVTIMLLITAIAISVQLIAARFTGIHMVNHDEAAIGAMARWLRTRATLAGVVVAVALAVGSPLWRDIFNSESAWPFVILGVGMPFYLVQAVGRGVLQGRLQFGKLAATFIVEMVVRVSVGITLVALGFGVVGATIALTVSFLAVWLHVQLLERSTSGRPLSDDAIRAIITYATPVGVLLLGQIIINNGDVLIAKGFLDPDTAGVYAAIALVGRAVFFLSWAVATTLFPAAAQRGERGEKTDGLLYAGMGIVALMGVGFVVGAALFGGTVLGRVFGPEYAGVSSQLAWYAAATSMFAIANLIVTHHLSLDQRRESIVMIGGGVVQTVLLLLGRSDIDSLIRAQVIAMAILLVAVTASHFIPRRPKSFATSDHLDIPLATKETSL